MTNHLLIKIKETIVRFALPLGFSLVGFIIYALLADSSMRGFSSGSYLDKNTMELLLSVLTFVVLMVAVSTSLVIANRISRNKYNIVAFAVGSIISLCFAGFNYFLFSNTSTNPDLVYASIIIPYSILLLAFNIVVFVYPVWKKDSQIQKNYFISYFVSSLVSGIIGGILVLGLEAAMGFIGSLFGINNLYGSFNFWNTLLIWIPGIVVSLIIPVIMFGLFSVDMDRGFEILSNLADIVRKIFQAIFMLFSSVYTLITLVYLLKVLFSSEVPSNTLATISIVAIVLNLITIFFCKLQSNKLSKLFSLLLPAANLIVIASYSYSIIVRISSYGFTVDRSLNLVLILLAIVVTVWLLISRRPDFSKMFITVALILVLSVLTPFVNIFHISEVSQLERIKNQTNNLDISNIKNGLSANSTSNNTTWYDSYYSTSYKNKELAMNLVYMRDYHGLDSILNQANWSDADKTWFKDKVRTLHIYNY